jgi:hypothetical protein
MKHTGEMGTLVKCPSLEEYQFDMASVRDRIAAYKERNKALTKGNKELVNKINGHTDTQFYTRLGLKDLKDRAKFVVVASNKNPGPIAQYAPTLTTGMEPHEMYTTSSTKVKHKAFKMLHMEAAQEAIDSGTMGPIKKDRGPIPTQKPCPANFSPHEGHSLSSVRRIDDHSTLGKAVILGLRSPTHWGATRRPAHDGPLLPNLNPPEGTWRRERKTAAWLSREGNPDMSRSRLHISRLAGQAASAPLL